MSLPCLNSGLGRPPKILRFRWFVLLGDLTGICFNTPAVLQSKLDALNLTQIIKEPTRYNPTSVKKGTLIDVILTNWPSKYTSAVFNQLPWHHCRIAGIR